MKNTKPGAIIITKPVLLTIVEYKVIVINFDYLNLDQIGQAQGNQI